MDGFFSKVKQKVNLGRSLTPARTLLFYRTDFWKTRPKIYTHDGTDDFYYNYFHKGDNFGDPWSYAEPLWKKGPLQKERIYSQPSQEGMPGQHRANRDTTWQRRIAVCPTLARFFVLAGQEEGKFSLFRVDYYWHW